MTYGFPVLKDLVLIGGGHSHVEVLRRFAMEPMAGVRLTLISRDTQAPYSGMLPGLIAGHYGFDESHIDLRPLALFARCRFLHDEVVGLDPNQKLIVCRQRPAVPYDVVSINIGSTPGLSVPGAAGAVVAVKPIDSFWQRWKQLRDRCLERCEETHVGVVGGGAGGVELLLAVQFRLAELLREHGRSSRHLHYHLLTATDEILPSHNARVRARFRRVLQERDVDVRVEARVARVTRSRRSRPFHLEVERGDGLDLDEVLWVTTARAADWPGASGLDVDEGGFIEVRDTLQTTAHPEVFAAGDIAAVVDHPRAKAGVFAVRQGPPLAENLRSCLIGEPTRPFYPQHKFLSLISTGDKYAVASRGEWAAEGAWVWRWKDRIDRRFMERYNRLPAMEADREPLDSGDIDPRLLSDASAAELVRAAGVDLRHEPPGLSAAERALDVVSAVPMRCGGCGSKVGSTMLRHVLATLHPLQRDDVIAGLEAADDAAVIEVPAGMQQVVTVDFFRALIDDPFVFGKVAAQHALGDVFAMGATPQAALATVTVPFGLEAKVAAELTQLLAGAVAVFNAEGTALIGGHTSEGADLALGFTVTGLVRTGETLGKGGMRPGDGLLLTKPLGVGALFAADMRRRARGPWIEAALRSMTRSQRVAARCLIEHGATAMTDVSGFGLLGHIVEMTRASSVDVTLDLSALPALAGALEVMGEGIFSSLHADNLRLRRAIINVEEVAAHPAYPLIFDPQTAGGLLASVPGDKVRECVNALRSCGCGRACAIGEVRASDRDEQPVRLLA